MEREVIIRNIKTQELVEGTLTEEHTLYNFWFKDDHAMYSFDKTGLSLGGSWEVDF